MSIFRNHNRQFAIPCTIAPGLATGNVADLPVYIRLNDNASIKLLCNATADDVVFVDAAGNTLPYVAGQDPILQTNAYWSWFSNPRAARYVGTHDRTYVAWFDSVAGSFRVGAYDHKLCTWSAVTLRGSTGSIDDHNNPSIAIGSDGAIYIAACIHASNNAWLWRSTSPETMAFTEVSLSSIDTTISYPQLLMMGSTLFLSWRSGSSGARPRRFSLSTNGGTTWSSSKVLCQVTNARPYIQQIANGTDRVDIAMSTDHPEEISAGLGNLYHFYYRLSTDSTYKTDGTLIGVTGTTPATNLNTTLIYDASSSNANSWPAAIAIDRYGRPVITHTVKYSPLDNRCRYSTTDGVSWTDREVAVLGENLYGPRQTAQPSYHPGVCLDPNDPAVMYLVKDDGFGHLGLYQYTTANAGLSWQIRRISAATHDRIWRPFVPTNRHPSMQVLWCCGIYEYFQSTAESNLCAWPMPAVAGSKFAAVVNVDYDNTNGNKFWMLFGGEGDLDLQDLAGATGGADVAVVGEMCWRTLTGVTKSLLDGRTAVTVAGAFTRPTNGVQGTVLSDWMGLITNGEDGGHLLFRVNASNQFTCTMRDSGGTGRTVTATDIGALATNTVHGAIARQSSGVLNVFVNGSKSTQSNSSVATLYTATLYAGLLAGKTPHNATVTQDQWVGRILLILIYLSAKSDAWSQLLTKAIKDGIVTMGNVIANPYPQRAMPVDDDVAAIRARVDAYLDAAISTRATPGDIPPNPSGNGARTVTVTVVDEDDQWPLAGARVRLTNGADTYVNSANEDGEAVFHVDDGTYQVTITRINYTFGGDELKVPDDGNPTYEMQALVIPAPAEPTQSTGYVTTYDGHGNVQPGVAIKFRLATPPDPDGAGASFGAYPRTVTSDSNGLLTVTLLRGAAYLAKRGEGGEVPFTVPDAPTFPLPVVLSGNFGGVQ